MYKGKLLFAGAFRQFDECYEKIKENLLLANPHIDFDIFFSSWIDDGIRDKKRENNGNINDIINLYKPKAYSYKEFILEDILVKFNVDKHYLETTNKNNIIRRVGQLYNIYNVNNISNEYAIKNNIHYTFVVRTRFDIWIKNQVILPATPNLNFFLWNNDIFCATHPIILNNIYSQIPTVGQFYNEVKKNKYSIHKFHSMINTKIQNIINFDKIMAKENFCIKRNLK